MKKICSFLEHFFLNPRQYTLKYLIILLTLLLLLKSSVVDLHRVVSASMEDTLLVGDTLLVFKGWYGFRPPFMSQAITLRFQA